MKKRTYATAARSRWFQVKKWLPCAGTDKINSHEVRVGTWMRWTARHDGTACCESCLATQGIFREGLDPAREREIA